MGKPELEFQQPTAPWVPVHEGAAGVWSQILADDPRTGEYTRLLRFEAGVDTTVQGVRTHDYWEELYILEGDLTDLRLNQSFSAGMYACRPPGMEHGPWHTESGVTMLEIRRAAR